MSHFLSAYSMPVTLLDKLACLWFAISVFCSQTPALTSCCCVSSQETAFSRLPLPLASMWVWPVQGTARRLVSFPWHFWKHLSLCSSSCPLRASPQRIRYCWAGLPWFYFLSSYLQSKAPGKPLCPFDFSRNKDGCGYILCLISRWSPCPSFIGFSAVPAPV